MQLFVVNETDFTQFIEVPSYRVNEEDISDDWEDGNRVTHKNIVRTKIKGSFTLKFTNIEDFDNFFAVINANKVATGMHSGAVLASVYINDKDVVKSAYIFVKADPANTKPLFASPSYDGFEVTIEEQ